MNERINKLAEQAFLFASATDDSDESDANWWKEYNEKFAELIVRECADWIEKQDCAEHPTAWLLCDEIRDHFGVE